MDSNTGGPSQSSFDATAVRMKQLFLQDCEQKRDDLKHSIDKYEKEIESYRKVGSRMKEMIKKLELPTTAPICAVGFFCDAHIVRTNKVLVNLGDDYFVECSSYTAQNIVNRRIKEYQKAINDGLESIKMIEEKIEYTNSLFDEKEKDVVEICEPFDEINEKEFYEKRRLRKPISEGNSEEKNKAHELAMLRLEELEAIEAENGEIEKVHLPLSQKKMTENTTSATENETPIENDDSEENEENDYDDDEKENIKKMLQMPGVSEKEMVRLLSYLEQCDLTSDEENEEDSDIDDGNRSEDLDSDDYENVSTPSSVSEISTPSPVRSTAIQQSNVKIEEIDQVIPKNDVIEIKDKKKSTENVSKPKKKKKSGVRFAQELEKVKLFSKTDEITVKGNESIENTEPAMKSILRNTEPTPVNRDALMKDQKEVVAMSCNSFPGMVVEKNTKIVIECEPSTSKEENPEIRSKVSKFRAAQRQRKSNGA